MKKLILIFSVVFILSGKSLYAATPHIVLGSGGYLGRYQVGLEYYNFSLHFGSTDHIEQISLRYTYPILEYFTVGAFLTYTHHSSFFIESPSRYPSSKYYQETALRPGLSFGLRYKYFYVDTNILDTGLVILYNESKYRDITDKSSRLLWSTGFGVRIPLDIF